MSGEATRVARGSLAQQASGVTGLLMMLAIITVLARELTLAELGAYGVLSALLGYLLVVQNAAGGAAVRTITAAEDRASAQRAFAAATTLYAGLGLVTGVLLVAVAALLDPALGLGGDLAGQVLLGGLLVAAVTVAGWPLTAFRDALRAEGMVVRAAAIEIAALLTFGALVLGLALGGADLALVIGASGTIPLLVGVGCALGAGGLALRPRLLPPSDAAVRELLRLAGWVSLTEVAAAGIYVADRLILGAFTSAGTVAQFEGPIRAHNLIRALNSAFTVAVLPAATRLHAAGDSRRLAELLVRGVRYSLALTCPFVVVGMVLSGPILEVWLGPEFRSGDTAMTILMSHWLINGASGVLAAILIATGRARELAGYAFWLAASNVVLALALTPILELEGLAIATAVPYGALFFLLLARARRAVAVEGKRLYVEAFRPALLTGLWVAVALGLAVRALEVDSLPVVAALAVAALAAYWLSYYVVALAADERRLVRGLLRRGF